MNRLPRIIGRGHASARTLVEDLYNLRLWSQTSAAINDVWSVGRRLQTEPIQRLMPFPGDFPHTGMAEVLGVSKVLLSRRLSLAKGREVKKLEDACSASWGAPHAVACSSGTAALILALAALDVGPGDEVIVPAITYMATAMAVLQVGARPVFADVLLPSGNIDPASIAERITPRTRAVIAVHLSGIPVDIPELAVLCEAHEIALVEDVAQAVGGTWKGRPLGSLGDVGCFSFNAGKNMTTGQGGLVLSADPTLAENIRLLVHLGEGYPDGSPIYSDWHREEPHLFYRVGWNFKMSELNAAVGRAQLSRLGWLARRRRENGEALLASLTDIDGVAVPRIPDEAKVAFWRLPLLLDDDHDRDGAIAGLRRHRITCYRPDFSVLPDNPIFEGPSPALPRARAWHDRTLFIPTHPNLTWRELRDVAPALRRVLRDQA